MKIYYTVLGVIFCCCVVSAKDLVVEKISSPRRTPSTGVTIHKQTVHFIDLEVPVDRVWIGCTNIDPKEEVSLLGIDVEDEEINYSFYPRRAVHDVPTCLAEEKKYRDMLKDVKTVRVVGEFSGLEPNSKKVYSKDRTPQRFKNKSKTGGGFFIRLQAGNKCVAYFANGCDLPKNYWGGATPLE